MAAKKVPTSDTSSHLLEGGLRGLSQDFQAMGFLQDRPVFKPKAKSARLPISCDTCEKAHTEGTQPHGYIYCTECAQTMCQQCGSAHGKMKASRNHTVAAIPEQVSGGTVEARATMKDASEKDVSTFCPNHARSKLRLFCTVCNVLICDECIKRDHRIVDRHKHTTIGKLASTLKERIRSQLARVDAKSQECNSFMLRLDSVDRSRLLQDEMFDSEVRSMLDREKKRLEQSAKTTYATRNAFLQNQRQELDKLQKKSKRVKETLALFETEARTILEQESNDIAVVLSYQNLQVLQETIDKVTSERLDRSLLHKISDSVSQQLHFHSTKYEPSLGSLVMTIRDRRNISIPSCTMGPYAMTFTTDGRLAVVAQFEGAASQPENTEHYTLNQFGNYNKIHHQNYQGTNYHAVKQTDVKYESATQFEQETRLLAKYQYIASLSDLRFVLLNTRITTQPGGAIVSLQRGVLRGLATDRADNIYTTDDDGTIHVWRPNGTWQKSIQVQGMQSDDFWHGLFTPFALTCPHEADVLLFTHDSSKISVVDQDGNILRTITRPEWKEVMIGCDNQRLLYVLWKGADGRRTLQRYTFDGNLLDTLFENETHGCRVLTLSVSPDGTAAVVTNTGKDAEVTLISTAKKITVE